MILHRYLQCTKCQKKLPLMNKSDLVNIFKELKSFRLRKTNKTYLIKVHKLSCEQVNYLWNNKCILILYSNSSKEEQFFELILFYCCSSLPFLSYFEIQPSLNSIFLSDFRIFYLLQKQFYCINLWNLHVGSLGFHQLVYWKKSSKSYSK